MAMGVLVGVIMLMLVVFLLYLKLTKITHHQHSPSDLPSVTEQQSSGERGVEEEVIHSYPIIVFTAKHEALSQKEDKSCSICLEDYKFNEQLRMVMDCRHVYHVHCIDEWLTRHSSCPICRKCPQKELAIRTT